MSRALIIIGKAWLWVAAAFIALSYALILYFDGWRKLTEIVSPFNVVNWLTVIATLAPGYGLVKWGEKIERRRQEREETPRHHTH
ncbi:MAG: hypothetical protein WB713_13655 [Methyloceanibacter sp.]|jgi:hypothetical protein